MDENSLLVFSGNSNTDLAKRICRYVGVELGNAFVTKFADGETRVEIENNVRGRDVFVIQSTCSPANEHIMELLIMIDALRRASARRITAVIPYFGYARQERKSAPRTPITAKLVADLLVSAGVNRVLSLELHTGAIQGFFNVPVDHLFCKPVFFEQLKKMNLTNPIVVAPDAGGVERARAISKVLNAGLAIVDKRRDTPNESKVMHLIGDVSGKEAIIVDDICDTAGTLTQAAGVLKENGATKVYAMISHPVFSGPAYDRIEASVLDGVFVTDTIPLKERGKTCPKIQVLSVAELLGEAIKRIHSGGSVSRLFI